MVFSREEAAKRADASMSTSKAGICQLWTRTMFGAPSAGDVDGDGDADAVDGWKSEPVKWRHPGDRRPPRGVPVAWSGGRHGYGHRAVSLGNGMIRSTDAGGACHNATVPLSWFEAHWGLHYLGWSESMDGVLIPTGSKAKADPPRTVKPAKPPVKGRTRVELAQLRVQQALDVLTKAVEAGRSGEVRAVRDDLRVIRGRLDRLGGG